MKIIPWIAPAIAPLALALAGCSMGIPHRTTHATSVMDFLYPRQQQHIEEPTVPVLKLPLRVGIVFVPGADRFRGFNLGGITEAQKYRLLNRVADQFKALPYVQHIEVIPTTYLRAEGGFENLDQLKRMFRIDVVALVAYDQVQFTNEGVLSLAYWTIVGAYVVQGEKNDTQTLMEAAVFDISSRKLLFRAPGSSQVKASATPINRTEQLQLDSQKGFDAANDEVIANLKTELEHFKARIKEAPEEFKIEHKPGYTGGGDLGAGFAAALAAVALFAIGRRAACKGKFPISLG